MFLKFSIFVEVVNLYHLISGTHVIAINTCPPFLFSSLAAGPPAAAHSCDAIALM